MFVRVQSVFGCYCECLVVVECNFVCVAVCWWWHEVGHMVRVAGGPLYHIWLYLCVFGWVCLVVCWWWRGAKNMIDRILPFGCIWVCWLFLVVFGCVWLYMVVCWWWHGARNMIVGERGGPLCLLMGPTPELNISCTCTITKVKVNVKENKCKAIRK